jgi:hypothetical protein
MIVRINSNSFLIYHLIFVMETRCAFFAVGTESLNIIMRSLHEVHEKNAYRDGRVCLSVRPSVCLSAYRGGHKGWSCLSAYRGGHKGWSCLSAYRGGEMGLTIERWSCLSAYSDSHIGLAVQSSCLSAYRGGHKGWSCLSAYRWPLGWPPVPPFAGQSQKLTSNPASRICMKCPANFLLHNIFNHVYF